VVRAYRGLIHLHNGRDNLVENNIFVDGKLQQAEFNGWTTTARYWTTHLPTMIAGYNSVKDQPAWKKMRNMDIAPEQAPLPDGRIMTGNLFRRNIVSYSDPKGKLFSGRNLPVARNRWDANLYWHGAADAPLAIDFGGTEKFNLREWQAKDQDLKAAVAAPRFVDPAKDDYRLRKDSPAFALGFQPIPVEKIGPYKSELRASWPIVEAEGVREHPLVSEVH
jgi:hypothetical protein